MTTEQTQQILDYLKSAADTASNFASGQIPDIAHQIVLVGRIQYSVFVAVSLVVLVVLFHLIRKFIKMYNETGTWDKDMEILKIIVSSLLFVLGLVFFVDSFINLATAIWAPKLYILQYVQHLIH